MQNGVVPVYWAYRSDYRHEGGGHQIAKNTYMSDRSSGQHAGALSADSFLHNQTRHLDVLVPYDEDVIEMTDARNWMIR